MCFYLRTSSINLRSLSHKTVSTALLRHLTLRIPLIIKCFIVIILVWFNDIPTDKQNLINESVLNQLFHALSLMTVTNWPIGQYSFWKSTSGNSAKRFSLKLVHFQRLVFSMARQTRMNRWTDCRLTSVDIESTLFKRSARILH